MISTFETKKINMETLPEYLKSARESFSYSVDHVAKITNISPKFVEYMEAGYYHRLPADVYVYGF
jgi:cytoskeletal protein RodZ